MKYKEKNFVSAVIYVHNAEQQIEAFLKTIIHEMENDFEHSEIICVNDFSNDSSVQKIKEISLVAKTVSISLIHMSSFHGMELAMDAGVDLAIGDFVFEFDSTIQDFDSSVIMQVYHHALDGYDIVSASPDTKERWISRCFYAVFEHFADLPCRMHTERFRVLSRRVINRIRFMNKMIPYRKAAYADCGLKTDHLQYAAVRTMPQARSRKETSYRWSLAVDTLLMFTELGYRFSRMMTLIMMLVSVFMIMYSLVTYLVLHPIEGWTTTILFLSIAFFGLFAILTIVVKYLQLLFDMVYKRKHYSFMNVEKLTQ